MPSNLYLNSKCTSGLIQLSCRFRMLYSMPCCSRSSSISIKNRITITFRLSRRPRTSYPYGAQECSLMTSYIMLGLSLSISPTCITREKSFSQSIKYLFPQKAPLMRNARTLFDSVSKRRLKALARYLMMYFSTLTSDLIYLCIILQRITNYNNIIVQNGKRVHNYKQVGRAKSKYNQQIITIVLQPYQKPTQNTNTPH